MVGIRTHYEGALPLAMPGTRSARRSRFFLGVELVELAIVVAACGSGSVASAPVEAFYSAPSHLSAAPGGRDHGLLPRLDHRKSPVLDRGGELDSSVGQYLATTSSTISALTFIS